MSIKKALPVFLVLAVMALFLLPGLAQGQAGGSGGGGGGGSSGEKCPPPPPAGNGDPETPPRKCGHASQTATSETSETSDTATSETSETSDTGTSQTSQTSDTSGAECEGFVHLADNEVIADSAPLVDGVIGVHADLLPANASVNLARACVGLGSAAALGVDCEGPLAVVPDDSSGLFVCVEA